jgi:hypothetical protein
MRENGIQTEHGAGAGNPHNHLLFFGTSRCELKVAAANEIKAASIFALAEQRGLGRERNSAGGQLKVGQNSASKGTKPSRATIRTGCATGGNLSGNVPVPRRSFQ